MNQIKQNGLRMLLAILAGGFCVSAFALSGRVESPRLRRTQSVQPRKPASQSSTNTRSRRSAANSTSARSSDQLLPDELLADIDSERPSTVAKKPVRVLSREGETLKKDVKVEFGVGYGETIEEARLNALRDVLQKVVGVYVDSEFRMNNDQIIKDEILTHSNGFIEDYAVLEEVDDSSGHGKTVTVKARVKMRAFVDRMKGLAPKNSVKQDGAILGLDVENEMNAAALLRKTFEGFNPVRDLLEIGLVPNVRPAMLSSTDDSVSLRYVYQVKFSNEKYYKWFLPKVMPIFDQIADRRTEKMVKFEVEKYKVYPMERRINSARPRQWEKPGCEFSLCGLSGTLSELPSWRLISNSWRLSGVESLKIWMVRRISGDGQGTVKIWTLNENTMGIYREIVEKFRCDAIQSVLVLKDEAGVDLSQGAVALWDCVDFQNVIVPCLSYFDSGWHFDDVKGKTFWGGDNCYISRHIGYIDVTLAKEDVRRVRSAEIRLEIPDGDEK